MTLDVLSNIQILRNVKLLVITLYRHFWWTVREKELPGSLRSGHQHQQCRTIGLPCLLLVMLSYWLQIVQQLPSGKEAQE